MTSYMHDNIPTEVEEGVQPEAYKHKKELN